MAGFSIPRVPGGEPASPRWRLARPVVALFLLATLTLGPAAPASADPAKPTNYRSRILSTEPALPDGVDLSVAGGDAFLDLRVHGDHRVVVLDYKSGKGTARRRYLRFGPDGTVEENEHSGAAVANESRYGTTKNPDIGPVPRWVEISHDGRAVWHDHRIHWMLPRAPTVVDADGRVDLGGPQGTWKIDLVVDDVPTTVRGELLLLDSPNPLPWYALAVAVVATLVGVLVLASRSHRPPPHRWLAVALAVTAAAATTTGLAEWRSIPPGAGGTILTALVPVVGLLGAVAAAASRSATVRRVTLAVATASLAGWALLRIEVLDRAVLPTSLPTAIDRAATALALGMAVGTAIILAIWPPSAPRRALSTSGSGT